MFHEYREHRTLIVWDAQFIRVGHSFVNNIEQSANDLYFVSFSLMSGTDPRVETFGGFFLVEY